MMRIASIPGSRRSVSATWKPSRPGRPRSRNTNSGRSRRTAAIAAWPSYTTCTSWPTSLRIAAMISALSALSSTTRTRRLGISLGYPDASFGLDSHLLDHGFPLHQVRADELRERLGRGAHGLQALVAQALCNLGVGEDLGNIAG